MNLNFDIPTPKCCADCKFGYTEKDIDYSWIIRCFIDGDLKQTIQDGRLARHPECPGTVDD